MVLVKYRFDVICALCLLLSGLSGCGCPGDLSRSAMQRGCVFVIPGIEGGGWAMRGMVDGLKEGGINRGIDVVEWGMRPFGQMHNLSSTVDNRKWARLISNRIMDYRRMYPDGPVTLVGYSGGGGLALWIAEALPQSFELDGFVLVAAAISPDYDIESISHRSRTGVVNFYSTRDWLILNAGTSFFGTMDREKSPSAGYTGFLDHAGLLVADELIQQKNWRPEWVKLGHGGDHWGWLSKAWARDVLAHCILVSPEPKQEATG